MGNISYWYSAHDRALVPRFRFAKTSHLESVVAHAHRHTAPLLGVGQASRLYTGGSPQRTYRTRRRTNSEISSTLRAPHRGEGDQRRHLQQHRHRRTDGDFSRRATIRAGGRSSGAYAGRYRTQGRVRRQPQRRSPAAARQRTATTSGGGRNRSSGGRGSGSGWQRWRRG